MKALLLENVMPLNHIFDSTIMRTAYYVRNSTFSYITVQSEIVNSLPRPETSPLPPLPPLTLVLVLSSGEYYRYGASCKEELCSESTADQGIPALCIAPSHGLASSRSLVYTGICTIVCDFPRLDYREK